MVIPRQNRKAPVQPFDTDVATLTRVVPFKRSIEYYFDGSCRFAGV